MAASERRVLDRNAVPKVTAATQWSRATVPPAAAVLTQAGYPEWLANLLARRGVRDRTEAVAFFQPDLRQLHDPYLLAGLKPAVERLIKAQKARESIALIGDYDVDGVAGAALLTAVFRACGLTVQPILPHRLREGYGLQPLHVERAHAAGCRVVVTVDCGATSHAAAEAAQAAGLDLIVVDHHLPGERPLPASVVQINPRQEICHYPFVDLCGAGLAFKLATALAAACERAVDLRALARIACLGTIADLVPLQGENRVIAAVGLRELANTRSPGLQALIHSAGLKPPFSAADVGFRLGPRLNAPGRLASAEQALELLLSRDRDHARELAGELDRCNQKRQECEQRVVAEAREQFLAHPDLPAFLVAWSEHWHVGVVGIAAGRLAKEFHRPVLLLAAQNGLATGSGRSIAGIHLHQFLHGFRQDLLRFGGHAQAVGLTVSSTRLEQLRAQWEAAAAGWQDLLAVRCFEYELELSPREMTVDIVTQLQQLEPHGPANPAPLIRVRGPLRLVGSPRIFGRGHLSATAAGPAGDRIRLLGWGWGERTPALQGTFEALGQAELDRYTGSTVLRLVDCRPSESPNASEDASAS